MTIKVTVWNEYLHEIQFKEIAAIYPKGIHGCIAEFLEKAGMEVQTATLEQPEHGLTEEVLKNTDVLIWWGHMAHRPREGRDRGARISPCTERHGAYRAALRPRF